MGRCTSDVSDACESKLEVRERGGGTFDGPPSPSSVVASDEVPVPGLSESAAVMVPYSRARGLLPCGSMASVGDVWERAGGKKLAPAMTRIQGLLPRERGVWPEKVIVLKLQTEISKSQSKGHSVRTWKA